MLKIRKLNDLVKASYYKWKKYPKSYYEKYNEDLTDNFMKESRKKSINVGIYFAKTNTIYISKMPVILQTSTLIHELMHCFIWQITYNLHNSSMDFYRVATAILEWLDGLLVTYVSEKFIKAKMVKRVINDLYSKKTYRSKPKRSKESKK